MGPHRPSPFPSIALAMALLAAGPLTAQTHFEKVVDAEPFSIDGMAQVSQIKQSTGRGLIVTNATIDPVNGADMLLQVVDGDGAVLHDLVIGGPDYHDICKEVVQIGGAYYLAGHTRGIDTAEAHTFTAFVIKVDTALASFRQINYILPGQELYANAITATLDGRLLIAGQVLDGSEFHTCVMKTDTAGTLLWAKQYDIPFSEGIACIRELSGGDILLSGSVTFGFELSLPLALKLGPTGTMKWGKYYNYPAVSPVERSSFQFIRPTSVSDVLLVGHTDVKGAGGQDFYVAHIDTSGTSHEVFTYGGTQFDEPYGVDYDASTGVLMVQGTSASFSPGFQPQGIGMRIATQGSLLNATLYGDQATQQPIDLYQYTRLDNASGLLSGVREFPANDIYLTRITNTGSNPCNAVAVTPTVMQDTTSTGDFTAVVTALAPQANALELPTYHFTGDTLLCAFTAGVADHAPERGFSIQPNPGEGTLWLDLPPAFHPTMAEVQDVTGRPVHRTRWAAGPLTLPADLPPGLFLITLRTADGTALTERYVKH